MCLWAFCLYEWSIDKSKVLNLITASLSGHIGPSMTSSTDFMEISVPQFTKYMLKIV